MTQASSRSSSPHAPNSRESSLRLAVIFCGIDICLNGYAAYGSNSVTILGSLFKELADFIAMLSAFATVRAVRRAPNERFAYGVGKLENLVSVGTALLMAGCGIGILYQAIDAIKHPRPTEGTLPGILLFAGSALVGFWLWQRNLRALRHQSSAILQSQAHIWFSKALFDGLMATALILALRFTESRWSAYLDPVASLVGVAFLFQGAWAMASSSVGDLLDSTLEETTKLRIMRHMVEHFADYEHLYQIRTRRSGPRVYVEIFLQFDPELRIRDVEQTINGLRSAIGASIPGADVTICPVEPSAPI
jgi:cation diffusion facilitator family transporter